MLVVNCVINPDSMVTIDLTRSISALEELYGFPPVKNATISLNDGSATYTDFNFIQKWDSTMIYNNNDPLPHFERYEKGYYENRLVKIAPNTKYTLEIRAEGYNDVLSETEIPSPVEIEKVDTFSISTQEQGFTTVQSKAKISLNDPADQANYYRIKVETASITMTLDQKTGIMTMFPYYSKQFVDSNDPVFGNDSDGGLFGGGSNNTFSTFNDLLFNGISYSIEFTYKTRYGDYNYEGIPKDPVPITDSVSSYFYEIYKIELLSLSESYFTYLNTIGLQKNSENDPFSDPVLVYTNIENGTGIFGSFTKSDKFLVITNFTDDMRSLLPFTDDNTLFNYLKDSYSKIFTAYY